MSKYDSLWQYFEKCDQQTIKLTFDEIETISGVKIDHSFLNNKKELLQYGYQVGKISLKDKTVIFTKTDAQV